MSIAEAVGASVHIKICGGRDMWWEKKLPVVGEVLFRNDFPPRPEDFAFLEAQGIASKPDPKNAPGNWTNKDSR